MQFSEDGCVILPIKGDILRQYFADWEAPDVAASSRLMMISDEKAGDEDELNKVPLGVKVNSETVVPPLETKKL